MEWYLEENGSVSRVTAPENLASSKTLNSKKRLISSTLAWIWSGESTSMMKSEEKNGKPPISPAVQMSRKVELKFILSLPGST